MSTSKHPVNKESGVLGERGEYAYPMPYMEPLNIAGVLDPALLDTMQPILRASSPVKDILLSERQGDVFVEGGFDLQRTIEVLDAPVLEVGGPSQHGFEVFKSVAFSSKPLISNIASFSDEELRVRQLSRDDVRLDLEVDARALPFMNESLGVVMAHGLTKHSEEFSSLDMYEQNSKQALAKLAAKASIEMDAFANEKESSRVGLLFEAWRTLKEGGLLVLGSPTEHDMRIAMELGFRLREHTRLRPERLDWSDKNRSLPTEVVLQKLAYSEK